MANRSVMHKMKDSGGFISAIDMARAHAFARPWGVGAAHISAETAPAGRTAPADRILSTAPTAPTAPAPFAWDGQQGRFVAKQQRMPVVAYKVSFPKLRAAWGVR